MVDLRLAVTDSPVGDCPEKIRCLKHADKVQSLAVYPDHLHCYGCGYHRMGLWGLADLLKVSYAEAEQQAPRYTVESLDAYRERVTQTAHKEPLPSSLATVFNSVLWAERRPRVGWFYARGLTDESIASFTLGHNGVAFTIPIYDADENLLTIRYRKDPLYAGDATPKYQGIKGRNGQYVYPEWWMQDAGVYLWLVEGELDAVRLWQEGQPALTITNGAGQVPKLPAIIRERWPWVKHLLIATDQDEPGQEAAKKTEEAAIRAGFDELAIHPVCWDAGKDITEALSLGWDYRTALAYAFGG